MEATLGGVAGTMPLSRQDAPSSAVIPAGGRVIERDYTNRAGTRAYKLYILSGYVDQAVPLVVMLHGCTQHPDNFANGTHMNALAEEYTFLVAYPTQAQNANMSKCWN
jgi:poly(3-hydroxybutyrate) depolymerase